MIFGNCMMCHDVVFLVVVEGYYYCGSREKIRWKHSGVLRGTGRFYRTDCM